MKNTDKMLISKLTEIGEKLEGTENIEAVEKELHAVLDSIVGDYKDPDKVERYRFEKEKAMDVFAVGETITLCKSRTEDRADYIELNKENTIMPRAFEMEGFEDMRWDDMHEKRE